MGKARHGARGDDIVVKVPEGTVVKDLDGNTIADLPTTGDRWLAAQGGQGGKGNARFLSNRRRAPAFAEQGEVGEERWFNLELKLMADVALVGFPNAGKSTLISRDLGGQAQDRRLPVHHARAQPRRGPSSTTPSSSSPTSPASSRAPARARASAISSSATSSGPGCSACSSTSPRRTAGRPVEQERILLDELGRYRPELLERPRVVIGTKADVRVRTMGGSADLRRRRARGCGAPRPAGDARGRRPRRSSPIGEGFVVHRPVPEGVGIERGDDGRSRVLGRPAVRAVAVSDLTNADALAYVQGRLKRLGVDQALARAGARDGDIVRIGDFTFEFRGGLSDGSSSSSRSARRRSPTPPARSTTPRWPSCAPRSPRCGPAGDEVVIVTSGAIAAGLPALGLDGAARPTCPRCRRSPRSVSAG